MDNQGLLFCARYAASPNFFGYCGPDKSSNIIDHLKENIADRELGMIIAEFETLYPYLQLISKENKIPDPFAKKVVEAYWIGNSLLKKVSSNDYLSFLKEKLVLDRKTGKDTFRKIKEKIMKRFFLPHHAFHVFNIFKRTGKDASFHTLHTMNECRIGWGKVIGKQETINSKQILIETKPLIMVDEKLKFGETILKEIYLDYKNNRFIKEIKNGDLVSFHWSMVCDIITENQVRNLSYYTQKAIDYYNSE